MSHEPLSMTNIPTNAPGQESRRLGKYLLLHKLGQGGMGEVWLAKDTIAEIEVALKFLPAELRDNKEEQDRLKSSFRLVEKLQHPAICRLRDLQMEPSVGFFLVMDYFDGVTLSKYRSSYVRQHGSIPTDVILKLLTPVAEALDYAHSQKIVHRDIKPANILVSRDGTEVKIIDFQLAWELRATLSRITQKQTDTSGTYPYMAPELWLGARANAASDQYALAMVAYELLDGQLPYEATDGTTWRDIVTHPQVKLPLIVGLAPHVQQALNKALGRDTELRPQSCREFTDQLSGIQGTTKRRGSDNFPPPPPLPPPPEPEEIFDVDIETDLMNYDTKPETKRRPPSDRAPQRREVGTVILSRTLQWSGCLSRFQIYVDGKFKASLWTGCQQEMELPEGRHTIEVRCAWLSSKLVVDVKPRQEIRLHTLFHWTCFWIKLEECF